MKYDFDTYIERRNSDSYKWDGLELKFGKDNILPYWVADMDFKAPPEVLSALAAKVEHGVLGYPLEPDSLYEAIMDWEKERHGFEFPKEAIHWSPGVVSGLAFCLTEFTNPGDGVIIQTPVYHPFYSVIEKAGRRLVKNPLKRVNGRYTFDLEQLESVITPTCRTLMLCSPHNPVARVWDREELEALADLAERKDLLVLSDEIHQDIVYSGSKHVCFASLSKEAADRTITLFAPSKTFNIAGLSSSVVVATNESLGARFASVPEMLHMDSLNALGLVAMEAAYRDGADWLDELLEYLEDSRDFTVKFLKERMPKAKMDKPEGTFVFWIDFRGYGFDGDSLRRFLVDEAGVALNNGADFGSEGDGFARLNIGTPRALLAEGLERIAQALERTGRA